MGDASWPSVYGLYLLMALFVVAAVTFLAHAVATGAVRDDEAPKYRMLDDELVGGDRDDRRA